MQNQISFKFYEFIIHSLYGSQALFIVLGKTSSCIDFGCSCGTSEHGGSGVGGIGVGGEVKRKEEKGRGRIYVDRRRLDPLVLMQYLSR